MASHSNMSFSFCLVIRAFLTLFFFIGKAFAGDRNETPYNQGRLYTIDGYRQEFIKISIGEDSLWYWSKPYGQERAVGLENISRIEIQKGTRAAQFALIASGLGLLISSVAVLPSDVNSNLKFLVIGGITVGSGLANFVYGGTIKKYEVVYKNPRYK